MYKYEKGKLICYKNLNQLYKNENITNFCQISDDEYIFTTKKKKIFSGTKDYLSFYNMKSNKILKTLKLEDTNNDYIKLFLLNKDNLIAFMDNSIILVGVKNKEIINVFNYSLYVEDCIFLNEKIFLNTDYSTLTRYEFEEPNNIQAKEKMKIRYNSKILKLRGNKLIGHNYEHTISIYG